MLDLIDRHDEVEMSYRENVLRGLGFDLPEQMEGADGRGNDAWQRALSISARVNAQASRN